MTATPRPFFSVIVPTLNGGPKLGATLDSVLEQADADREILVMDGGSTDGTLALLQGLSGRLTWQSAPDAGVYDAMNRGIGLATGHYLCFLGAGDRLRPDALGRVRGAAPDDGLDVVYGDVWIVRSARLHGGGGPYPASRLVYDAPCHQGVFYARPVFDALGRYDTRYPVSADWAFNIRCFGCPRVRKVYLNSVVADFEGGGLSANGPDAAFLRDRPRLLREGAGIETRGSRFFAADQFLALRITGTRRKAARKFWRVQRWALHRLLPPPVAGGPRV